MATATDSERDELRETSESPTEHSEEVVIALTRQVLELTNARDHDNPTLCKLLAPNFKGDIEGIRADSREQYLANHRKACEANPDYHLQLIEVSAEVDERRGRAKVWGQVRVHGWNGNVVRASVTTFSWSRRDHEWTCFKFHGLRGIQNFSE